MQVQVVDVQRSVKNNKGLSLVELMIALVILQVSLLGLLSVIVNAISVNLQNELRNTSIRLTNQTAEAIFSLSIDDTEVSSGDHTRSADSLTQNMKGFPNPVQNIRGGFEQTYSISWTVRDLNTNLKEVSIAVQYTNPKGENISNNAVIYKHRAL